MARSTISRSKFKQTLSNLRASEAEREVLVKRIAELDARLKQLKRSEHEREEEGAKCSDDALSKIRKRHRSDEATAKSDVVTADVSLALKFTFTLRFRKGKGWMIADSVKFEMKLTSRKSLPNTRPASFSQLRVDRLECSLKTGV